MTKRRRKKRGKDRGGIACESRERESEQKNKRPHARSLSLSTDSDVHWNSWTRQLIQDFHEKHEEKSSYNCEGWRMAARRQQNERWEARPRKKERPNSVYYLLSSSSQQPWNGEGRKFPSFLQPLLKSFKPETVDTSHYLLHSTSSYFPNPSFSRVVTWKSFRSKRYQKT